MYSLIQFGANRDAEIVYKTPCGMDKSICTVLDIGTKDERLVFEGKVVTTKMLVNIMKLLTPEVGV